MDDARECWVCLELADTDRAAAAPTGCACRGSAGCAHVSCLAAAARHKEDRLARHTAWRVCPTCKQRYTGPLATGLARARWALHRDAVPEADAERMDALAHLANALTNSGDRAGARPLSEMHVAVQRRTHGLEDAGALQAIINLASLRSDMGEPAAALPLLKEALPGCRRVIGEEHAFTLRGMATLARVHSKMGQRAAARSMYEEVAEALRKGARVDAHQATEHTRSLGAFCVTIGDFPAGVTLLEEAVAMARRVLGEAHPETQNVALNLAQSRKEVAAAPPHACAIGRLVGLAGRPELNGNEAWVVGFDKGRYRVRLGAGARSDKPLGIKPANLALRDGTAVIVEGVISQPAWNGRRGLVQSFDAARGRYALLVQERARPLGVKLECCRLESLAERERHMQEAAKRVQIEERVRAALDARRAAPEPEPES